jgi:uncharacterized membrane protein YjgN (DUF898 family)
MQGGYGYGPPPGPPPQMPPGGGYGAPAMPPHAGMPQPGAMVPVGSSSPVAHRPAAPHAMSPVAPMVGGVRLSLAVTGGELLGKLFVGYLLCLITVGIYVPWFLCGFQRYLQSRLTIGPTARGNVRLSFTGRGGQLFVIFLVNYLLMIVTLGFYGPWALCRVIKFFTENTQAHADDGTQIQLRFEGTGGDLFVTILVGYLLTVITIGIYLPWFICSMQRLLLSKTKLTENGAPIGSFDFSGTGGSLLGTFIVGYLLTLVTFGIYGSWFQVKIFRFFASNTRVDYHGRRFVGDFMGKGLDLFLINVVGWFLIPITLGIYFFWFLAKLLRFQTQNLVFHQMG